MSDGSKKGRDGTFALTCAVPDSGNDTIQLAHGGGGRAMARLFDSIVRPAFDDPELDRRHDGAVLPIEGALAFTTDSYVVKPLFFPGGDIGTLAVNGTVNDLAMCGAKPLYLSVGFILEEGFPLASLRRIACSMRDAARAAHVRLVTGDTKVVDHGKADGVFINTSGVGQIVAPTPIGPNAICSGDAIILSGDIGRHGMAVMAAREGFGFETPIESDCAPIAAPVLALIEAGIGVHCLRDLTRGGLASALVEIAETGRQAITIDETAVPVRPEVGAACELLGLDPLHVANEGRFVAFVSRRDKDRALEVLRRLDITSGAVVLGEVHDGPPGQVSCRGPLGVDRVLDMLNGEQLPRIC
ncbi:hydrogenase expression/formation protein HypE [Enhydrobacter aerosaccus]|uniref:Hydrogenase expression/formation protein HypE n=1 Tax=Enhydrobacter aerosaccus TaxID=225324 RepID=A0A1T4T3K3_9HYPH|nr:hydrogenase expression/formation protein HypE [Enhydrobacter aerosaccus]SKA34977.1 hydrogenase expression/formation protein HypE [Enhydrobacter aerosaccus]